MRAWERGGKIYLQEERGDNLMAFVYLFIGR
jgi:hypothetical protein